jgi:DNA invertase Pin-like site-specific DNA recombinase
MKETSLAGKRYINLVRCSSSKQADTSLVDQLALLSDYAARHGMTHVDDVLVDGVSGSIPGARHDFDKLIQRKETREDFDVVLLQDTSRLTRAGNEHGAKVEYDFQAAGIEVVYVAEDVPEGEFAGVLRACALRRPRAKRLDFIHVDARTDVSAA